MTKQSCSVFLIEGRMEYAFLLLVFEAPNSHKRTRERSARDILGNQNLLQKYGVDIMGIQRGYRLHHSEHTRRQVGF